VDKSQVGYFKVVRKQRNALWDTAGFAIDNHSNSPSE